MNTGRSNPGHAMENPEDNRNIKKFKVSGRLASNNQSFTNVLSLGFSAVSLLVSFLLLVHILDLESSGKKVESEISDLQNQLLTVDQLLLSVNGLKRRVTELETVNKVGNANE